MYICIHTYIHIYMILLYYFAELHKSKKQSWKSSLMGSSVCSVAEPSAHVDVDH